MTESGSSDEEYFRALGLQNKETLTNKQKKRCADYRERQKQIRHLNRSYSSEEELFIPPPNKKPLITANSPYRLRSSNAVERIPLSSIENDSASTVSFEMNNALIEGQTDLSEIINMTETLSIRSSCTESTSDKTLSDSYSESDDEELNSKIIKEVLFAGSNLTSVEFVMTFYAIVKKNNLNDQ